MKKNYKNLFIILGIALVLGGAAYNAGLELKADNNGDTSLKQTENLAEAECKATLDGKVVAECTGNEGTCSVEYKKWGHTATLDCDGTDANQEKK